MAGYIGAKQGVTQVDGYNRSEADAEFVQVTGDTMTGTYGFGGFISLQTSDNNGYPRINGASSSAQLGLFRSSGGAEGGFFLGGDGGQFSVWSSDFVRRMNVDTAGRVTMPYQPAFAVSRGATTGDAGSTITISSASISLNNGSHFNNTNGRFTAPVSGVYLFSFFISRLTQSGLTPRIDLSVNGSISASTLVYSTSYSNGALSWVDYLNAGDFAVASVVGTNNGTPNFHSAYFSGYLLG